MDARQQPPVSGDRSVGELFADLADETGRLIQQEVRLASAEMTRKAMRAGRQAAAAAVGMLFGTIGLLCVISAIVLGIATTMPLWASALVVGLGALVIGALIVARAMSSLSQMKPLPARTIQTLREDKQWAAQQVQ